jgi:hypothetical protein
MSMDKGVQDTRTGVYWVERRKQLRLRRLVKQAKVALLVALLGSVTALIRLATDLVIARYGS